MVNTINQSFTEVYDIIMHFEKDMYSKIPPKFLNLVKQNRDMNYKVNIDYNKNLNEQNLLQKTKIILSLIYRDFLCSPEQRNELIEKDKIELELEEKLLREKYNPDNIFKKMKTNIVEKDNEKKKAITENIQMTIYKESIFKSIINSILRFFHIK